MKKWRSAIAPNLSPATVRPRESYLSVHIMPVFERVALLEMDVSAIQQFATDLRKTLSGKTVVNILGTVFTILDYAERCGMKVPKVGFTDLQLGSTTREKPVAFFTRDQAQGSWHSPAMTSTSTVVQSASTNPLMTARGKFVNPKQSAP